MHIEARVACHFTTSNKFHMYKHAIYKQLIPKHRKKKHLKIIVFFTEKKKRIFTTI